LKHNIRKSANISEKTIRKPEMSIGIPGISKRKPEMSIRKSGKTIG
jgi:hypothetical protein